jgi:MOSC domain-containing protein YiiM
MDATTEPTTHDRGVDRDLDRHLEDLRAAPRDLGRVVMIVRRPDRDTREVVDEAVIDEDEGLVGDNWRARGSRSRPDGSADPESQLTVMSTRVLAAIEPDPSRWPLAGDQLLVDLDLSVANLPPGTLLAIGEAVLRVSETPHTGCAKFSARFGSDALRWINSPTGRELRMRGLNGRVVRGGTVRVGDAVRKA